MYPASLKHSLFVVELFSGHGDVSDTASWAIGCPRVTVDIIEDAEPMIQKDIRTWTAADSAALKALHPDRRPIVFASPPCENYSRMNTTGTRDLESADELVAKVREISEAIGAVAVFVENPATGCLAGREVVAWLPHSYVVDYCQYGALIRKSTRIWSTIDLTAGGFVPRRCLARTEAACQAIMRDVWSNDMRHVGQMVDMDYCERIMVPRQLIVCLLRAAIPAIRETMNSLREAAAAAGHNGKRRRMV